MREWRYDDFVMIKTGFFGSKKGYLVDSRDVLIETSDISGLAKEFKVKLYGGDGMPFEPTEWFPESNVELLVDRSLGVSLNE